MKKLLLLLPIFIFAGTNNSYAFKKGYQEGLNIKRSIFGVLTDKQINSKCIQAYERNAKSRYIKENKDIFIKGCKEALKGF